MTGLNGILNTLHIRIYIPSRSEFCQYEHMQQLGDVMTKINATMLIILVPLIIFTQHWMIGNFQYLLHTTSKFKIHSSLKPPRRCYTRNARILPTPDQRDFRGEGGVHPYFHLVTAFTPGRCSLGTSASFLAEISVSSP